MYLDADVFWSILYRYKDILWRYRSFLEEEELLYVFVFETIEFIFDWTIIESWNLIVNKLWRIYEW